MTVTARRIVVVLVVLMSVVGVRADEQKSQEEMVTVTVPKSSLTPTQQATVNQQEVKGWVGIGKEIGDAVNSSLAAVTTQSNNFAHTPVGALTAGIVIWKVVGGDFVHILGGIAFALLVVPFWVWSYHRMCVPHRVLVRETISPDKTKVREYEVVNSRKNLTDKAENELDGWTIAHWCGLVLIIGTSIITIFTF